MDVAEINRLLDEAIARGAPKEATEENPNKENRFAIQPFARSLLSKILRDYNKKEAKSNTDPRHYLNKIHKLLDQSNLVAANAPEKLDVKQRDLLDGVLLEYVKTLNEDDNNERERDKGEEGAAKANLGKTPKTKSALEQEEAELEKGKEKFAPKNPWPMQAAALDTTFADNYTAAAAQIQKTAGTPSEFITSFTGLLQLEGQLANFLSAVAEGTFADEDVRRMVANGLKSYITAYIGKMIVNKEGDMLKEVAKNDMPGYATAILQKVRDQIAVPRIPPAAAPSALGKSVSDLAAKGVAAVKEHGPGIMKTVTEKFNQMRGKPGAAPNAAANAAHPPAPNAAANAAHPPAAPPAAPIKQSMATRAKAWAARAKDKLTKKKSEEGKPDAAKLDAAKLDAAKPAAAKPAAAPPEAKPAVDAGVKAAHAAEVQRMNREDQIKGTAGKEAAQAKAAQATTAKADAVAKRETLKTELAALKAQASKGTPAEKLAAKAQIEAKTTQIAQQKDVVKGHEATLKQANKEAKGPGGKELAQIKSTHALEDKQAAAAKGDALKKELDALKNAPPTAAGLQKLKEKEAELNAHQTVIQKTEADAKAANRELDIKTTNRARAATMHAADAARSTGRSLKNFITGTARGTAKATSNLATNVRLNANLSKALDRAKHVTTKYDQLKTTENVKDAVAEEKKAAYERVKRKAEEEEELYAKKKKDVKRAFDSKNTLETKKERIQKQLEADPDNKVLKHDLEMAKLDFNRASDLFEARNSALTKFHNKMMEAEEAAENMKQEIPANEGGTRRKRGARDSLRRIVFFELEVAGGVPEHERRPEHAARDGEGGPLLFGQLGEVGFFHFTFFFKVKSNSF